MEVVGRILKMDTPFLHVRKLATTNVDAPPRFKVDGIKGFEDIDECKEKTTCQCPECSYKDTWEGCDSTFARHFPLEALPKVP